MGPQAPRGELSIAGRDRAFTPKQTRVAVLRAARASIAIPIAFVALVDYHWQSTGIDWFGALGALVALSLIVAITVVTARR